MKFNERVWDIVKKIPKGKVTTYKEIAKAMNTKAYQAIGNALNKNPYCPYIFRCSWDKSKIYSTLKVE